MSNEEDGLSLSGAPTGRKQLLPLYPPPGGRKLLGALYFTQPYIKNANWNYMIFVISSTLNVGIFASLPFLKVLVPHFFGKFSYRITYYTILCEDGNNFFCVFRVKCNQQCPRCDETKRLDIEEFANLFCFFITRNFSASMNNSSS